MHPAPIPIHCPQYGSQNLPHEHRRDLSRPGDRVRAGVIGSGGRGQLLTVRVQRDRRRDGRGLRRLRAEPAGRLRRPAPGAKPTRLPQPARRQVHRRRDRLPRRTTGTPHGDRRREGRQGRLHREADGPHDPGGLRDRRGRASDQADRAGGHAAAQLGTVPARRRSLPIRPPGRIRLVTSRWLNHQDFPRAEKLEGALDWKQWLGPAPKRELDATRFFNWYYYWDYSGGLLIGQAAHIVDAIQWFMGSKAAAGGDLLRRRGRISRAPRSRRRPPSSMEYPENYLATFTLGYKAMRYHTSRTRSSSSTAPRRGWTWAVRDIGSIPETSSPVLTPEKEDMRVGSFVPATRDHIRNFLECVRTRQEPNAPVEAGLATAIVLCMTLDSLRSGRRLRWNAQTRRVES